MASGSNPTFQDFQAAVDHVAARLPDDPGPAADALEGVEGFGRYEGTPPEIRREDDGRTAHLLKAIAYHGPDAVRWPVPAGAWLDGASIPRAFWTIIGGPFEGRYRNASIVHDHYCITQDRAWRAVHQMFYDAMRCSGVGKAKATVMYYAVYRFGPRWTESGLESVALASESVADAAAASFARDADIIIANRLGPREAEALADAHG